jgi:uncharacterized protein (TIGR00730 family)
MAKTVTVFCGSSGGPPAYQDVARELAKELGKNGLELCYGGGHVGLMGILADTALSCGVKVTGIIPKHLFDREIGHTSLTELLIVGSMHERKFKMAERGDIFIALPGGFGTLDEFFEIITWAQIGLHTKPCGILNFDGFFDDLIKWMDNATSKGYVKQQHRDMLIISDNPQELLTLTLQYENKVAPKWSDNARIES